MRPARREKKSVRENKNLVKATKKDFFTLQLEVRKWWGWSGKAPCVAYTLNTFHLRQSRLQCENPKAMIYFFRVTSCSPCVTILFATTPICSNRMRRSVNVRGFHIWWGIHCIPYHKKMSGGFPYGQEPITRSLQLP